MSTLTQAEARARLERMTAFGSPPTLTTGELDDLMSFCSAGTSWDLNLGAAEGWRWKAGKAAHLYSFSIESDRSEQGMVYQNCIAQAAYYAEQASSGGGIAGTRGASLSTLKIATDVVEVNGSA